MRPFPDRRIKAPTHDMPPSPKGSGPTLKLPFHEADRRRPEKRNAPFRLSAMVAWGVWFAMPLLRPRMIIAPHRCPDHPDVRIRIWLFSLVS